MKGGERWLGQALAQARLSHDLVDALLHLLGGFVGEGHGQNGVRRGAAFFDQVGDAVRDDAGLARARTGQQQHRAVHRGNALLLLRIHVG